MSEILFRGKRTDNGEWVYGGYWENQTTRSTVHIIDKSGNSIEIIPETIGRYTGLTDKNGRKIFEGDILQCNNNPKDIVKVVFGKFSVIDMETESAIDEVIGWHYEIIPTTPLSTARPFCLPMPLTDYYINRCDVKIVGNIHDNPELLEGEEK